MMASLISSRIVSRKRVDPASRDCRAKTCRPRAVSITNASTASVRIAWSVCSSSSKRARSSMFSARSPSAIAVSDLVRICSWAQAESGEHPGRLAQVTDESTLRKRLFPHEGRRGDDQLSGGQGGLAHQVEDLEVTAAL